MAKYQAPRGTQDILPKDQPDWELLRDTIRRLCHRYGYRRIDLPLFEETNLFVRGVGQATDIVEKEMYSFVDKGGDSLTLLPEATASVVRAYLEHGMHVLPQPVKLYTILPNFRYDRPQAGRFRQFHVFDAEALGEQDPALDAEVISLAWRFYQELGLQGLTLQLNSIGDEVCRPGYVQALTAYFRQHRDRLSATDRQRLRRNPLRLLDSKEKGLQPLVAQAPRSADHLCDECARHFSTLRGYLEGLSIPYQLNHRLVRGLDYYTKTVFEFWAPGIGAQNAVGGGGRYDGLAEQLGGPYIPAIGFALGLERIVMTLKRQRPDARGLENRQGPQVFVAYRGEEARKEALLLAESLRERGLRARMGFGNHSLKAQMRQADREGAFLAAILGEEELSSGRVTLRQLSSGEETQIERGELVSWLKRLLAQRPLEKLSES